MGVSLSILGKKNRLWLSEKKQKILDIYMTVQFGLMKAFVLMFYGSKKYIHFVFKRCLAGKGYQRELQQRTQKHLEKAQ